MSLTSPISPLAAAVDAIRARAGVAAAPVVRDVRDTATSVLVDEGHPAATVVDFRWGRLVVEAPSAEATLLRYDTDKVLERLEVVAPGEVSELVVRVAR